MASLYIDIILPVKVNQTFTYAVGEEYADKIAFGVRVEVPFGSRKFYAGMIVNIHHQKPDYEVKYISSVLDEVALIYEWQFEFWRWMSDYYMASIGDIMRTALPTALQVSSATKIKLTDHFEGLHDLYAIASNHNRMTLEFAIEILNQLQKDKFIAIDQIVKNAKSKRWQSAIQVLIENGWIEIEEILEEKYKPREETFIGLHEMYHDSNNREALFDVLKNKPKQIAVITEFLHKTINLEPLQKKVLLVDADLSPSSIETLIKHEILYKYKAPVSRIQEENLTQDHGVHLSPSQTSAYESIIHHIHNKNQQILLHGVTASGKTHVYFKVMDDILEQGKQVLYLLPEIALTTQLEKRIKNRFGSRVGVYHSKYSHQERVELWRKVYNGDYDIVLAARSGIFLPMDKLGMIVIDEEHDFSYKQFDPAPRYNARDAAVYLSKKRNVPVILGSATPSIDTAYNVIGNKYKKVELLEKFQNVSPPKIAIVDLKKELQKGVSRPLISSYLKACIDETLASKQQVILFHNRRGYVPVLECQDCGDIPMCKHCDINLTHYKYQNELRCHYCGYKQSVPDACPSCGSTKLDIKGFGTEKVEEELQFLYPQARIARMDLDSTRRKYAFQEIVEDMDSGEIDILIGTQMVTKGLDFGEVSLVGILSAENILSHMDYRSTERAFNMLTQVVGRSGRKSQGRVVVQTFDFSHPTLDWVMNQDFNTYYREEFKQRKAFDYPPFSRFIRITIKHQDVKQVQRAGMELFRFLNQHFSGRVLGPEFPPVPRIRNKYIQQILLKLPKTRSLSVDKRIILNRIEDFYSASSNKSIQLSIDVDPLN